MHSSQFGMCFRRCGLQRSIQLGCCWYHVDYLSGWSQTVFPDGLVVTATREDGQRDFAASLGYGSDVDAMNREHDFCHTLLMQYLGFPWSLNLRSVAGGVGHSRLEGSWWAESIVLDFQRTLNGLSPIILPTLAEIVWKELRL